MSLQRKTRSLKSVNGGGESIPIDLIIEIFSRLPAKSVGRFRCVSKLWASILHRPDFTELFLTRSSSRPQVLFAFRKLNEVYFFSIPQPRNHDEILSSVVANFVAKTPSVAFYEEFGNINGLVFLRNDWYSDKTAVICNPSTRQSFSIPHFSFLGYDPIEKQYKLMSFVKTSYKVLTLGSGNLLWRDILCSTDHSPLCKGICIDGVLYYKARVVKNDVASRSIVIVSFDIKSETFNFIKTMEKYSEKYFLRTLINYNGKLGSVHADDTIFVNGSSEILKILVLEDPKKQEWSEHIHVLSPLCKDVFGEDDLFVVGVIGTDEIVMSSIYDNHSLYLVYYNTNKKDVVKVEIKGMEGCKGFKVYPFLNHVENLKLLC